MVLVVVSCIGVCFGTIFSLEELARLVTITSFLICVTTFSLAVLAPHIVFDSARPGVWKGIFAHKNSQGSFMTLAFLTAMHARFARWKIVRYGTMMMSAVLLVLSHSSTALVALIIVIAALPVRYLVRVPGKQILIASVLVATIALTTGFLVSQYYTEILSLLGKDATLTGRAQLWGLIVDSIIRRPVIGYGYNGFWLGLRGESLSIIAASGWLVPHAHNGLLDLLLGIGVVGTAIFFVGFVRLITLLAQYIRTSGARFQDFWPVSFLVALTVINTTESLLLSSNSIFWLLYVAMFASLTSLAAARSQALIQPVVLTPRRLLATSSAIVR
jgi:O-antigen ligase